MRVALHARISRIRMATGCALGAAAFALLAGSPAAAETSFDLETAFDEQPEVKGLRIETTRKIGKGRLTLLLREPAPATAPD